MRVLILNSSVDTFEMLQEYFSFQGWETATCAMKPLREAQMTGAALMATYQPDVIVADPRCPAIARGGRRDGARHSVGRCRAATAPARHGRRGGPRLAAP